MPAHEIIWGNRGWQPCQYGFCPSEEAWDCQMEKLHCDLPYPTAAGRATLFKGENLTILITVNGEGCSRNQIAGILVHEAVHVWQYITEEIGEESAGQEIEAYSIQNIFINLLDAYETTIGFNGQSGFEVQLMEKRSKPHGKNETRRKATSRRKKTAPGKG